MSDCIYTHYHSHLTTILKGLFPHVDEAALSRIELTPTRDVKHGDMATNAAMILAGQLKKNPKEIANALVAPLRELAGVEAVEIAGPGFVNITLASERWQQVVAQILHVGKNFGTCHFGTSRKVNVEYISANPTGPMHVGHCRGAIVGDVLASVLEKTGFDVTREFYVNDAGVQVTALGWAAYWRYLQVFEKDFPGDIIAKHSPVGLQYGGDYLIEVGEALAQRYGRQFIGDGPRQEDKLVPPQKWLETFKHFAVDSMLKCIRADLSALGVHQDQFSSESEILRRGDTAKALQILDDKHYLYRGVLPPPKGKRAEDWESREQLLFRSTEFGDDRDRPLQKSDGSHTYFANDIGYHYSKMQRGMSVMIDVWGADHGGYVKRLKAAVAALSDKKIPLEVLLCQIVHILRDGEVVRMSKRAGNFVTIRELIDEVGRDAIRFTMLTRRSDAQMNFDLAEVVAQKRDNPIFYVQYAHARCCSVLRSAKEAACYGDVTPQALEDVPLESLRELAHLALIRKLAQWPRVLLSAAINYEPHRIAFYLLGLASAFHTLWNHGKDNATLRFLQQDHPAQTKAHLALIWASVITIRAGLDVIGVEPVEEMR